MAIEGDGLAVKICCGPRCGAWPGQRTIYRAIEARLTNQVRPTMCQGHCGKGVTVVRPSGAIVKIASVDEVQKLTQSSNEDSK